MSHMRKCDKCGTSQDCVEDASPMGWVFLGSSSSKGTPDPGIGHDLCEKCVKLLLEWIRGWS